MGKEQKTPAEGKEPRTESRRPPRAKKPKACFNCGQEGHLQRDCTETPTGETTGAATRGAKRGGAKTSPPVKRTHLVLATTVIKKVILRAIVPTKPSSSLKDLGLVVVPVEAATEDALKLVTDVDLKTIWYAIVLSQT